MNESKKRYIFIILFHKYRHNNILPEVYIYHFIHYVSTCSPNPCLFLFVNKAAAI